MISEYRVLGDLLCDPRIRRIAPDAIRNMDLRKEPIWNKTLAQLKEEHFGGEIGEGLDRLYAADDTPRYQQLEISFDGQVSIPSPDNNGEVYPSETLS